jgi:tRNA(His) 5'-end guanylyltransferase
MNDIGDRFKQNYEAPARHLLTRRTPVIVRVDGRAFHTFTRRFRKPFDGKLIDSMILSASALASEMQGFKLGYVQSDEASFVLTDYDDLQTQPWFGYVKSKVESISAAKMTFTFARCMRLIGENDEALFDARAFNVPEAEVVNYFVWRARDWQRNSVAMYAGAYFSHNELHRKSVRDMHEMLYGIGRNWAADLMPEERNGTFIVGPDLIARLDILPTYDSINALWEAVDPCNLPTSLTTLTKPPNTVSEVADISDLGSNPTVVGSTVGPAGGGIEPPSKEIKP